MDNFPVRLKKARTAAGLTQPQLAERLRLSPRAVSHWEQGIRTPSWPVIQAVAAALGIAAHELGELPMSPEPPTKPPPKGRPPVLVPARLSPLLKVPVVGTVGAGPATDEPLAEEVGFDLDGVSGEVVGYRVVGSSMVAHLIGDGDFVLVRRHPAPRAGELVVAWVRDQGMVLKECKGKGGYLLLQSDDGYAHRIDEQDGDKVYGVLHNNGRPGDG